MARTPM